MCFILLSIGKAEGLYGDVATWLARKMNARGIKENWEHFVRDFVLLLKNDWFDPNNASKPTRSCPPDVRDTMKFLLFSKC